MKFKKNLMHFVMLLTFAILTITMCGCGGESSYEKNARSGFNKWSNGDFDSMTYDEKKAVNDFLKWSNEHSK